MRHACRVVIVGVLTAALAGCGGGGGDNPALGADTAYPVAPAATVPSHPSVPVTTANLGSVEYPQVSGTPEAAVLNTALLADARSLTGGNVACAVSTLRSDTAILSFHWTCAGKRGLSATYATGSGRRLALGDLFKPGYLDQLSTTAVIQLRAGGASATTAAKAAPATTAAFGTWAIDPQSLEVTFTAGSQAVTVSFPLASLSSIINPAGALGH